MPDYLQLPPALSLPNSRSFSSIISSRDWSFGQKSIGFFGGFCLILNNAIGAGVAAIPLVFVRGGPILPIIAMIVIGSLSAVSAAMMCEAMRHVPGNESFRGRVEYAMCVKHFMGKTWYRISVFYLVSALLIMNIAAIIISAQGVDQAIVRAQGYTCGLDLSDFSIACSNRRGVNSAFSSVTLSQGYLVCLVLAFPLGLLNLDDNIYVQIISFFLANFCIVLWIWKLLPEASRGLPAYYTEDLLGYNYKQMFGSIMSNFAFVITVPSWCNEKLPSVNVNKTIWSCIALCVVVYGLLGLLAASVFGASITESTDFLALLENHRVGTFTALTCEFFPMLTALTGVPVCSIICRYNLLQANITPNVFTANLISLVLPWIISIPLQTYGNGSCLQSLLDWGSLLFSSVCNLVIPFLLYIYYKRSMPVVEDLHVPLLDIPSARKHWALPGRQDSSLKVGFAWIAAVLMIFVTTLTLLLKRVS